MKYFGEYLIEKKLITPSDLVAALFEQRAKSPSLASIAFSEKLISADDLLKIFKKQFEENLDFFGAAKSLNLWSPAMQEKCEREVKLRQAPLGQILIQNGKFDVKGLVMALDEFLSQAEAPSALPKQDSPAKTQQGAGASVQMDSFLEVDQLFSERTQLEMQNQLNMLLNNLNQDEMAVSFCGDIAEQFKRIRGLARFSGAKAFEGLFEMGENLLGLFIKSAHIKSEETVKAVAEEVLSLITLASLMLSHIKQTQGDEASFVAEKQTQWDNLKSKYLNLAEALGRQDQKGAAA